MKIDNNTLNKFKAWLNNKYENRSDKENIYGVGITDTEFRNWIIELLLGENWYVVDPLGHDQVNEEALVSILDKLYKKWRNN